MRLISATCFALAFLLGWFSTIVVSSANDAAPATIDPSTLTLTFSDEFDELKIARRNKPGKKWTAGLPYRGDFGKAHFVGMPRAKFPFRTENGVLIIEAQRKWNGKWDSGLLSSVDRSYNGFAQQFGYFEARMKMPEGPGTWPAFWLLGIGQGLDGYTAEIDIVEFYPRREKNYDTAIHVWYPKGSGKSKHHAQKFTPPNEKFVDNFNTYGVLVTAAETVFYLNREEISRFPTPKELHQPMFILLNLALEKQTNLETLASPQKLFVDYVRVYALSNDTP